MKIYWTSEQRFKASSQMRLLGQTVLNIMGSGKRECDSDKQF